jgi:hypothetical protein
MMVLMALATTFMTSPVLQAICPDRMLRTPASTGAEKLDGVQLGLNPAGD